MLQSQNYYQQKILKYSKLNYYFQIFDWLVTKKKIKSIFLINKVDKICIATQLGTNMWMVIVHAQAWMQVDVGAAAATKDVGVAPQAVSTW